MHLDLPLGFPQRLEGPMAWAGKEFQDKPELYVEVLSKLDISEIDQAIAHFKGSAFLIITLQSFFRLLRLTLNSALPSSRIP